MKDNFDSKFNPRKYLAEYYDEVSEENDRLLAFFSQVYKGFKSNSIEILEIGGGPTLYQTISMALPAISINFSDYLSSNLKELDLWLCDKEGAFDWNSFIAKALEYENPGLVVTQSDISDRSTLIRKKINRLSRCDIFSDNIMDTSAKYDLVSTNFVVESMCQNIKEVDTSFGRFKRLLKPGGHLVMTGLLGADYWSVSGKKFKSTNLTEEDVRTLLENNGFSIELMDIIPADHSHSDNNFQGYEGIFMVKARLTT